METTKSYSYFRFYTPTKKNLLVLDIVGIWPQFRRQCTWTHPSETMRNSENLSLYLFTLRRRRWFDHGSSNNRGGAKDRPRAGNERATTCSPAVRGETREHGERASTTTTGRGDLMSDEI